MIWNAYADPNDGLFGLTLKSSGHIFAKKGRTIHRPAGREDWLLFYVAKGGETFYFDREVYADEGSFVLFRPHEKQSHVYPGNKTGEFYYVHFLADESFDALGLKTSTVYRTSPTSRVCDLFEELISELQVKASCYETLCVGKLIELMSLLKRKTEGISAQYRADSRKIAFVVQHMYRNYSTDERLEDYAGLCNMSKFHFLRMFEQVTGMTPMAYKIGIRMAHAKALLEDLSLSVSEVGRQVGYASPSYFCDAFKKEAGMSPSDYRRSLEGED